MSNATDKPRIAPPVSNDLAGKPTQRSGRAKFDSRGNAVWEWQTEDGEFSTDVSTQRVRKLEAHDLSLEDTALIKKLNPGAKDKQPNRGFNPYDNTAPGVPRDPDAKRLDANRHSMRAEQAAPARKPVKDLKRLQEWIDMKKRLASQKDDD